MLLRLFACWVGCVNCFGLGFVVVLVCLVWFSWVLDLECLLLVCGFVLLFGVVCCLWMFTFVLLLIVLLGFGVLL